MSVIWGKKDMIEKCFDAVREWKAVAAEDVVADGFAVDCGHHIREGAPDEVVSAAILEFLVGGTAPSHTKDEVRAISVPSVTTASSLRSG